MFRSLVAGTMTAAILGLTTSMVSAFFFGTAGLPFIVGSSIGFMLGSWRWYATASTQALITLDRYPALIRMHLLANFPSYLRGRSIRDFNSTSFSTWQLQSMLVVGWLSAGPALEAIQTQAEAALVEEIVKDEIETTTVNRSVLIGDGK